MSKEILRRFVCSDWFVYLCMVCLFGLLVYLWMTIFLSSMSCSYITSVMMLFEIYIAMLFSLVKKSMGHTRFVIQYVTDTNFLLMIFLKDEICKYVNNCTNIIINIYVFINIFIYIYVRRFIQKRRKQI